MPAFNRVSLLLSTLNIPVLLHSLWLSALCHAPNHVITSAADMFHMKKSDDVGLCGSFITDTLHVIQILCYSFLKIT
jgi:hypothetical protein